MFTSKKVSAARMNICRQCKYFAKNSGTCGPLGIGKRVQYKGQKYKLCGCMMEVKTRIAASGCPVGFWGRDVAESTYERAKQFIEQTNHKRKLTRQEADELVALSNEILKVKRSKTGCGACLKAMQDEMKRALDVSI
jgi:hypothetical protein